MTRSISGMPTISEEPQDEGDLEVGFQLLNTPKNAAVGFRGNLPSDSKPTNQSPRFFSSSTAEQKEGEEVFKNCSAVFFSLVFILLCSFLGDGVSSKFYNNDTGWGYGAAVGLALLILYKKCFIDRDPPAADVTTDVPDANPNADSVPVPNLNSERKPPVP